ncbi:MAG: dihydrofolate reductase family protein [Lachnospiraceae bacterium]|nr:dihydrofolate reductase family protein [Lachnospiraceae bacterium]
MNRPYIICHMLQSIDGKVTGMFLFQPSVSAATEEYYRIHREYKADAFACGRITMEDSFTAGYQPDLSEFAGVKLSREDYIADKEAVFYAVAFDRKGRLGWKNGKINDDDPGYDNAHIIEVLCENVSDAYLAYLRKTGISYIFAGKEEMSIATATQKLYALFGIRKLLLEGGSILNGAFQREGLVDELSLVQVPVVANKNDKPLFYGAKGEEYSLKEVKSFDCGANWFQYIKK